MNERTRSLWLPGMTMLISSAVVMYAVLRLVPPIAWANAPVFLGGSWLFSYVVFGALGAYWSRRRGGSIPTRFAAGVFPVALHVAIFITVLIASATQNSPRTPEWLVPGFLLRVFLSFILLPAIALALGALPFLRNRASESAPSRA